MSAANFNRVARVYRWAEYLTFGCALERCRFFYLSATLPCRAALVLGDGDGRFLAGLLRQNPAITADVVDSSSAMLALLQRRIADQCGRVTLHHADALAFVPPGEYDLVATHFFLDCFATEQVKELAASIARHARPGALWLVSDFNVPTHSLARIPARLLVRGLYLAFRLLTGLRPTRLPDHAAALRSAGFQRISQHPSLGGLLISELWKLPSS
ncbi:MAG: class I SAM-dependent methyltransferase [Acidobacteriaceae bacterium]